MIWIGGDNYMCVIKITYQNNINDYEETQYYHVVNDVIHCLMQ